MDRRPPGKVLAPKIDPHDEDEPMASARLPIGCIAAALLCLPPLCLTHAQQSNGSSSPAPANAADIQALQARIVSLQAEKKALSDRIEVMRGVIERASADLAARSALIEQYQAQGEELDQAHADLGRVQSALDSLQQPQEEAGQSLAYLEETLANIEDLAVVDDRLSLMAGGTTYAIENQLLFKPGSAALTANGQKLLGDLASRLSAALAYLADDVDWALEIDSFSDDAPRGQKGKTSLSNRALSVLRANAIANSLAAHAIPLDRLEPAGFGRLTSDDDEVAADDRLRSQRTELRFNVVLRPVAGSSEDASPPPDEEGPAAPDSQ